MISILELYLTQFANMIIEGHTECKYHLKKILDKMPGLGKWRYGFMMEVFVLLLSIKGRTDFLQLARYGAHGEQRYRGQFEKRFDFLGFNKELVMEYASEHRTIAFDPGYVSKSGKATPGVGWWWSGCAGKLKWGMEIGGIAAIDIDNHTAFHLEAVRTPQQLKSDNLLEHYADTLIKRKEQLLSISKYVVADAYFSKHRFVSKLCENGFELVSRLRDDAHLQYLFKAEQSGGKGRPKKYDGKIDLADLNTEHLTLIGQDDEHRVYQGVVYSRSLKRDINLVIVYSKKKGVSAKWSHKLYFCTDPELSGELVLKYYRTRFQIEFTYRDSKQFTGLNDCQARSENKLHFHFNASLTAVNLAKVAYWLPVPEQERKAFSLSDVRTVCYNELLLKRFFNVFGISPNIKKNKTKVRQLIYYGAIAA